MQNAGAMPLLPEIDNAMLFLSKNILITGPNNLPSDITIWVSHNIMFDSNDKLINDDDTDQGRNVTVHGPLNSDIQHYKIFHGTKEEMNAIIMMNSPWFLIYVIATKGNQNQEPHILSCPHRNQTGQYYLMESAGQEVLVV